MGDPNGPKWGWIIGIGVVGMMCGLAGERRDQKVESASPSVSTQRAVGLPLVASSTFDVPTTRPQRNHACVLRIAGQEREVPVFPTQDGLDEFIKAAANADAQRMAVAMDANAGFLVAAGTRCAMLEFGLSHTKIRVLAGSHIGEAGWVPPEWMQGQN